VEFNNIQSNFTAGEIGPEFLGRVELEKYFYGVATLENMIVKPSGGLFKRGGFHYITDVKDATKNTVLINFIFRDTYSYILEFGDLYIRVYINHEQVQSGATAYEIITTYTTDEVKDLRFSQDSDTLYITHKDHPPATLTRIAHDNWTLADIVFTFDAGHEWTAGDYPSLNWFYEQRHFFTATPTVPNGLWASQSVDYTNMQLGTGQDNEGIEIIVKSAYKFLWGIAGDEITLGGSNAEFKLSANALNEPITPSNIRPSSQTKYGSTFTPCAQIDNSILFIQKGGRKLRRLALSPESSGSYSNVYTAPDLTLLNSTVTKNGIVGIESMTSPESIIWAIREDGILVGLTYEPEHKIYGWHRHNIGGTDAKIKNIAVASAPSGERVDDLWAIIEHTINGSTTQYLAYMDEGLSDEKDIEDSFFLDAGITKTGTGLTLVANLDHLEGEEVQILGDGAKQAPKTVVGGEITLDTAADKVHVGLSYKSIIETNPVEWKNPEGTSQGKLKRISEISLRLHRSLGFDIGDVYGNLDTYYFGPPIMDEVTSLFTGDTEPMPFAGGYDLQSKIRIEHKEPLPFNLLAIIYRGRTK